MPPLTVMAIVTPDDEALEADEVEDEVEAAVVAVLEPPWGEELLPHATRRTAAHASATRGRTGIGGA